ncbi:MAG: kinase/pyrophosphorylase [Aliidongia sp.]
MSRWCRVCLCRRNSSPLTKPLVIGLTNDPERLIAIRRNRMNTIQQDPTTPYVDLEAVRAEVTAARRLCHEHKWPVIDVTRRSIEETDRRHH